MRYGLVEVLCCQHARDEVCSGIASSLRHIGLDEDEYARVRPCPVRLLLCLLPCVRACVGLGVRLAGGLAVFVVLFPLVLLSLSGGERM